MWIRADAVRGVGCILWFGWSLLVSFVMFICQPGC